MAQFWGFIPRLNNISGIRTLFQQWWGFYDVTSKETDKIPTSKETCRQRKRIKDYENHNKEGKKGSQKKTEQNQSIGKAKWKKECFVVNW